MTGLVGYNALVTGGGRGIGAAVSVALAEAGACVAMAARNEAQVVEVAADLRSRHLEAFAFRCDVTDPHDVRNLVLSATEAMGRVDILVNTVNTATANPIDKITVGEWDHLMAVNATGTFLCTQAVFEGMLARRWGRIVNVAAKSGVKGEANLSAYTAAEHAVVGFTKALAVEARSTGVTVNAVCHAWIEAPLLDETITRVMRETGKTSDEAAAEILARAGQSRLIEAPEVADVVLEFCSEDAKARSGEIVVIDGNES